MQETFIVQSEDIYLVSHLNMSIMTLSNCRPCHEYVETFENLDNECDAAPAQLQPPVSDKRMQEGTVVPAGVNK